MSKYMLFSLNLNRLEFLRSSLDLSGHSCTCTYDPAEMTEKLDSEIFDVCIVAADSIDPVSIIEDVKLRNPGMPVVVIAADDVHISTEQAASLGVAELLSSSTSPSTVMLHAEKAVEASRLRAQQAYLIDQVLEGEATVSIVGKSRVMGAVRSLVSKVSKSRSNVLLIGETGTGKEVVAQAIHQASGGKDQPLIKVNCPGIPSQLFESELFGHMKGSFTGAFESKKGKFELAGSGNILLDEISELPLDLQAKMLRVLESRSFTRIGGTAEIAVEARIIAATNRDLSRYVKEGRFREDLFYRLNVFPILLPPLRERKEDIRETALHLLCHIGSSCGLVAEGIGKEAMKALEAYTWPGNVRELRNVLERALVLAGGGILEIEHLPWEIQDTGCLKIHDAERFGTKVEAYKKELLLEALQKHGWVKKKAAQDLGLTQRAFSHYVVRFDLDSRRPGARALQRA